MTFFVTKLGNKKLPGNVPSTFSKTKAMAKYH